MLTAVEGLIAELRQVGLPVSLSENVDAIESLGHVWLGDREEVKAALGLMLVKNHEHQAAFDTIFDLYFSLRGPDGGHGPAGQPGSAAGNGTASGTGSGGGTIGSLDDATLTELLVRALRDGDEVMMRIIAGQFVRRHAGIDQAGRSQARITCSGRCGRRPGPAAGHAGRQAPGRLEVDEYTDRLDRFRQLVEAEIRRRLVEDRGAEAVARTLRKPLPEDVDFLNASRTDLAALRAAIQPLARKLAARLAQKRRHKRRGALDFRRTVRRSLSTGGVPAEPVFRKPRPAKPELMVVADISGSVSSFAAGYRAGDVGHHHQLGLGWARLAEHGLGGTPPVDSERRTVRRKSSAPRRAAVWASLAASFLASGCIAARRAARSVRDALRKSTSSGSGLRSVRATASAPRSSTSRRLISASTSWRNRSSRSVYSSTSRRPGAGPASVASSRSG